MYIVYFTVHVFLDFSGKATVPVLWDKTERRIISNESADILRLINSEFNEFCPTTEHRLLDLYPKQLRRRIDRVNEFVLE